MPSAFSATLAGLGAIAIWGLLALLAVATGTIPPFQTFAMAAGIGALVGFAYAAIRGRLAAVMPPRAPLALGLYGMFVDTTLYLAAVKLAPAAEANLVHYLWPLLIVVFASFLPGGRLTTRHLAGAGLGFAACILLVADRIGGDRDAIVYWGLAAALAGALVWASYSVASRRFASVPSETLSMTLLVASLLAFACHFAFETTHWPATRTEWIGILGLGLGPIGGAFFLWDYGMKRGDVAFLGVASYAAPVLSTIALVVAGFAAPTWGLAVACALIVAGAVLASGTAKGSPTP